jgi:subtilisin family serine protease
MMVRRFTMPRTLGKTCLVLGCAVLLIALIGGPARPQEAAVPAAVALPDHVPGEVLVKFRPDADKSARSSLRSKLGASLLRELPALGVEQWRLGDLAVTEALVRGRSDPSLQWIEPNYLVRLCEIPDDPDFPLQWGLRNTGQQVGSIPGADVQASHAWDVFVGSEDVLVAVLDSGVDPAHPDLIDNLYTNPGEIPDNGLDDDSNGYVDDVHGWNTQTGTPNTQDLDGHGTTIAGIIGGRGDNELGVAGMCWRVRILPVRWTSGVSGDMAAVVAGILYAVAAGADVINCSLGSSAASEALREALELAGEQGMLAVCAAGNEGHDIDVTGVPFYPAAFDLENIVSVAATTASDELAFFSNWGLESVDLAAPGLRIWSTEPGGGYGLYLDVLGGSHGSGTSFSAPFVAGTLALMLGHDPDLSPAAARERLLASVDPLPDLAGKTATGGRLNAFLALADPDGIPPAAVSDLSVSELASSRVTLAWTASGDDGGSGQASTYQIRFATFPLDAANFAEGTPVVSPPDPGPPGSRETLSVSGLEPDTEYYFALRVLDEWGAYGDPDNVSPVSNVVVATTLGAPVLVVEPLELSADLLQGDLATRELTLRNSGAGVLDVVLTAAAGDGWLAASPPAAAVPAGQARAVTITLNAADLACGEQFGTLLVHSNDAGQPELAVPVRVEVSGPAVLVLPEGDFTLPPSAPGLAVQGSLPIVNTGCSTLVLGSPLTDSSIFSVVTPGELTVPAGESRSLLLTFRPPGLGSFTGVLGFATDDPARPFVTLALAGEGVPPPVLMVAPDSLAGDVPTGGAAFRTLMVRNPGGYPLTFAAAPAPGSAWISARPAGGTVAPGDSLAVRVTLRAGALCDTLLAGSLVLQGLAPADTLVNIPATLNVTAAADIVLDPFEIDFGQVPMGSAILTVSNQGCAPHVLTVFDIWCGNPVFQADPVAFSLEAGESQEVVVTFFPRDPVDYHTRLTVESDDPDHPVVDIDLYGQGLGAGPDTPGHPPVPGDLDLHAAPNPFNPTTEIRFVLPRAGRAVVRVYDLRGALVQELNAGEQPAGPLSVTWRGRDRSGRAVPSGAYLYRLSLDGRPLGPARRMVLVR